MIRYALLNTTKHKQANTYCHHKQYDKSRPGTSLHRAA